MFIDGCFFHGCPEHYVRPRSNVEFWEKKLSGNVERDRRQTLALEAAGWKVFRFWEHEVFENHDDLVTVVKTVVSQDEFRPGLNFRVVRVEETDRLENRERRYLQDLRDPRKSRTVDQVRSTRKWARRRPQA